MNLYRTLFQITALIICITVDSLKFDEIYFEVGLNVGDHVKSRLIDLISSVPKVFVSKSLTDLSGTYFAVVISFGNTTRSKDEVDLTDLEAESFRIRSQWHKKTLYIYTDGLPLDKSRHKNISFSKDDVHYGAVVGSYAVLEILGFGFLHPLDPYIPQEIRIAVDKLQIINKVESPRWPERCFHLHTQVQTYGLVFMVYMYINYVVFN